MGEGRARSYYLSRKVEISALFREHARAWRPLLISRYGDDFAKEVLRKAGQKHEELIPRLPYIGGENFLTTDLIRSTTSLALFKAMKAQGKRARDTGKIIYDAVRESVRCLPPQPPIGPEKLERRREQANMSHLRRYPGDWVWDVVDGDGVSFDYGYDFFECGTQKLYHAEGADSFLPFYCYLDFVTYRTAGWGFMRTGTLAEGHEKCDFRFKAGGSTERGWPPPFLGTERV